MNGKIHIRYFLLLFITAALTSPQAMAQLATCKGKYLGNIISNYVPSDYTNLWNGVTSENGCKWGSIERTRNQMNWTDADKAYQLAKQNGYEFRYHALAWGSQYPQWLENLSPSDFQREMEEYMRLVAARYGDKIDQIDVLNEQLRTHAPGTSYFRNGLGGTGSTGYDWIIWLFQKARLYFPEAKLVLNDYGLENDHSAIREMLQVVKALKDRNLIDGFGTQAHEFNINNLTAAQLKASLDLMATGGVPIYVTELDISGDDQTQKQRYERLFPVYWEHPDVAGVTLWGYIHGQTWKENTGLIRNGQDRPAMTWLRQYMASRPNVCNTNQLPTVSITSPANNTSLEYPASIQIAANATDADGSVARVDFYNGTTLLGSSTNRPYTCTIENAAEGTYSLTAVAIDNKGATNTSSVVTVRVAQRRPYNGTPTSFPGRLQLEQYDQGGPGISHHDLTPGNEGDAPLRDDDVDIEYTQDTEGTYNIGWVSNGEWLAYTVDVTQSGVYNLDLRYAVNGSGRTLYIEIDGKNVTGTITLPNTNGWQNWATLTLENIELTAGVQTLRIMMTSDYLNLNYLDLTPQLITDIRKTEEARFSVHPNPFTTEATIVSELAGIVDYTIYSTDGIELEKGSQAGHISVGQQLQPGVYLLKVKNHQTERTIRICKQ